MITNPTIEAMLNRKSVRKYTDQKPGSEVIETVVRAGQQAPFAAQLCSLLLSRKKAPFGAPLWFTICVDMHRMDMIMAKRGWTVVANNLSILLLGIQDAALMAENMVIAAESLGMGSCFLGNTPSRADRIQKQFKLPKRVFPLVELVMGYPAEELPTRPRYPLEFTLFEDKYPDLTDEMIEKAMKTMDEGYLAQGYYRKQRARIKLEVDKAETFTYDNYSWTEHISRKWGQWFNDPKEELEQLEKCGFAIPTKPDSNKK
jgi:nitroreductase